MPGYNHYPHCGCGWCVKHGGSLIDVRHLSQTMNLDGARRLLRENGVRIYLNACFVKPNAKCPVCGDRVYYYQNAAGSRVYFDELGPPWPKHPCTDRAQSQKAELKLYAERPRSRKRGLSLELVEAAHITGVFNERYFRPDGYSDHWTPIEIISLHRDGWRNHVTARYLESDDREEFQFDFDSSADHVSPGDIIALRRNEVSLYDVENSKERRYKISMFVEGA